MMEGLVVDIEGVGKVIANARTFKSGKTGYGAYGKITVDGEVYQLSLNIVKPHSEK